jgi:two-component system phosphate regulon sensor histidine kinase PhoR
MPGKPAEKQTGRNTAMTTEADPREVAGETPPIIQEGAAENAAPIGFLGRLNRGRIVLIAAILVFAALIVTNALTLAQGLIGFAVIAAAALINRGGTSAVATATTARRNITAAASDRVIGAVVAGLPDPAIVVDRQMIVTAFNSKAQGISPAIVTGLPVSLALRVPDLIDAIRRAVSTGQGQRVEFFERVPADRWSEAFVAPITLPDPATGDREMFVVTLHDLTPIHRVEEMRADFVANASHELRTPLASLSGFIETLQGPAKDDANARARFLGIMKTQATRMARLIDDLLSLSRIELKVHLQPQTQVDLVSIARHVADGLQLIARDRDVEIKIDMPATPLIVRGDRDELMRAFENLIENALKYGAAGKRIEVTGRREQAPDGSAEAVIAVRDFGPGIAPEHLPRLTERFYRVDVAESRAQGGTGLGLALAKHVFNRHRGRLTIDSILGQGATFTARLPVVADDKLQ